MPPLDNAARTALLQLARAAIARAIGADLSVDPLTPAPDPQLLAAADARAGVFVTLRTGHELRGCIGYPYSDLPLIEVVQRCAVSAATTDPRFPALEQGELRDVSLEISVLGPVEPVADISDVTVGRHGLIAEYQGRRGLLLPQVASEWGWNAEEFVSQTCAKAGLARDAWRHGAHLYRFEAEVFEELR